MTEPARRRFGAARIRHHVALGALSVAMLSVSSSVVGGKDPRFRASMATAYASLAWLIVCLSIGPLNLIRRRPNPVSTDLRRDVGIWAAALAVVHAIIGLQVHLRGRMEEYFLYGPDAPHRIPLRHDLFGAANYSGLASALLLIMLLAISNDLSLRRLGTVRWKQLQRWNYVAMTLIVGHGIAYQALEHRAPGYVLLISMCLGVGAILQLWGALLVRGNRRAVHLRKGRALS